MSYDIHYYATHPVVEKQRDNVEAALRKFEAAHAIWMDTPTFSPAYARVKAEKDKARQEYVDAQKSSHPDWIII